MRRHAGGMPLLTDLNLAVRTDPLALIRGTTEFVTVIYGPAITLAFHDVKVKAYRRSVLHLNLKSIVDGSALNWCEQNVLCKLMSEDFLFAKIAEPEMTLIIFNDYFCDRMGEVETLEFEALRQTERQNNKNSSLKGLVPKSERRNEGLGQLQTADRRNN